MTTMHNPYPAVLTDTTDARDMSPQISSSTQMTLDVVQPTNTLDKRTNPPHHRLDSAGNPHPGRLRRMHFLASPRRSHLVCKPLPIPSPLFHSSPSRPPLPPQAEAGSPTPGRGRRSSAACPLCARIPEEAAIGPGPAARGGSGTLAGREGTRGARTENRRTRKASRGRIGAVDSGAL